MSSPYIRYKGGRPKIGWKSISNKAYHEFIRQNPTIKITQSEYSDIIRAINQELLNHILEGEAIILQRFIVIYVNKYKYKLSRHADGVPFSKILTVDWGETQKQGKTIYYLDNETDQYKFGFQFRYLGFVKELQKERKKTLRSIPNNSTKKQLQQKIQSGFTDYIQYEILDRHE